LWIEAVDVARAYNRRLPESYEEIVKLAIHDKFATMLFA
jgi:hypothetical protein